MAATSSHPTPEAALAGPVAALPGFCHAYAEVNGTRLHYVIGGKGPAVVLLHGWPYTWAVGASCCRYWGGRLHGHCA